MLLSVWLRRVNTCISRTPKPSSSISTIRPQPGFWDDAAAAQEVSKKASNLRDTLNAYDVACGLLTMRVLPMNSPVKTKASPPRFKCVSRASIPCSINSKSIPGSLTTSIPLTPSCR